MGRLNLSTIDHSLEMGILAKKGVGSLSKSDQIEQRFAKIMGEVGLDPRTVMCQLAWLLNSAETDAIKLAAVKFATQLWMHPAVVARAKEEEKMTPVINFVIEGQNVQINNVLRPRVIESEMETI